MAKQEQHDIREYYIMAANIDPDTAGVIAVLPIPFSAQVIRLMATVETVVSVNTNINLERNGLNLTRNGLTALVTLNSGDAAGTTRITEMDSIVSANYLLEGEDGNGIADLATLTINSSGETAAASYTFMITLRA